MKLETGAFVLGNLFMFSALAACAVHQFVSMFVCFGFGCVFHFAAEICKKFKL